MSKSIKIITTICLYVIGVFAFFYPVFYIIGIFSVLFAGYLFLKKKTISFNCLFWLITFFIFGILNTSLSLKYDDDLVPFTNNNDVNIKAEVLSIPTNNLSGKTKFYARVFYAAHDNNVKDDINAKTLVTVTDEQDKINEIKIGDILTLSGRLKAPEHSLNPYQFDYARYLQFKKTFSLMYVTDNWEIASNSASLKGKLIRKLNDTRTKILDIHRQNIKSPMIEVLGGIIFGDDAVNPDDDTKDAFLKSGIFHILAASGMNVTLIFGIWFFFAKKLRFNYKFSIISGILLISVYTCMTGFGPPIIRAFLMLTLILIGKLIDRATSTMSLLFIVGLLMLIYNPLLVFDVGFQLSFTVTFALILTSPILNFNIKNKFLNSVIGACMIPLIAQIFAAPLQMFYFNTFSLYSVITNIAIVPVLSIVSFIGFISSILALIPIISHKICLVADFVLNPFLIYIVKTANFFSNLPYSIVYLKKPTVIQLVLYFSIIILIVLFIRFKVKSKKYYIPLASIIVLFGITFIPPLNHNSEITFFAVGNADAIMIKSPQNKYYILDTGKLPYMSASSQAKMIILNYLRNIGVKELDSLILSHFDSDHAGGTIDILKELNVKNVYISDSFEDTKLSANIIKFLDDNKIQTTIVNSETQIANEQNFRLKAIRVTGEKIKSENEKSVIVLFEDKDNKILFMGDGNINTYNYLPQEYKTDLKVLKVGHHGAKDTLNKEMIDNSDYFIISTGINIYNHPSVETLNMIREYSKTYFRTDKFNALKFVLKPDKTDIYAYSPTTHGFKKITQ